MVYPKHIQKFLKEEKIKLGEEVEETVEEASNPNDEKEILTANVDQAPREVEETAAEEEPQNIEEKEVIPQETNEEQKPEFNNENQQKAWERKNKQVEKAKQEKEELAKQFEEMKQEQEALKKLLAEQQQKQQVVAQPQQAAPEIPDRDLDPDAYNDYRFAQLEKQQKDFQKEQEGMRQLQMAREEMANYERQVADEEYKAKKDFVFNNIKKQIKRENPLIDDYNFNLSAEIKLLGAAGQAEANGLKPTTFILTLASESGYTSNNSDASVQQSNVSAGESPNLTAINRNKATSSNVATANGVSGNLNPGVFSMMEQAGNAADVYTKIRKKGQRLIDLAKTS